MYDAFKKRENVRQHATAIAIAAIAGGDFENYRPFPPPPRFLTVEEAEAASRRLFQVKNGQG
jgi:hypothetical protein